jgi:hypothetical protein
MIEFFTKNIYKKIFIIILLCSINLRFIYTPIETILDADSTGYLAPALNFLETSEFHHLFARSYAYPIFCLIILSIFKNITAIAVVQHFLSLLSILALFFFIEIEYIDKNKLSRLKEFFVKLLVLIFFFFLLLDGNLMVLEKTLRPEGLVIPTMILFFSLFYLLQKSKLNNSLLFLGVFFAYSFIIILLHPRFTLGIYCILMYQIGNYVYQNKKTLKTSLIKVGATFLLTYFIVTIHEKKLINRYDQTSPAFGLKQFYYSNLFAVSNALNNGFFVNRNYDYCVLENKISLTLAQTDVSKYFLGYNIDFAQYSIGDNDLGQELVKTYLLEKYNVNSNNLSERRFKNLYDSAPHNDLYIDYYKKWFYLLITKYPIEILKKTLYQMYISLLKHNYHYIAFWEEQFYKNNYDKENRHYNYLKEQLNFKDKEIIINYPPILSFIFLISSILIRFILLCGLIHILIKIVLFKNGDIINIAIGVFIILSIFLVAFTHTFDIARYMQSLLPVIYFFVLLSLLNFIDFFIPSAKKEKSKHEYNL